MWAASHCWRHMLLSPVAMQEQLFINLSNEHLQMHFNNYVFKARWQRDCCPKVYGVFCPCHDVVARRWNSTTTKLKESTLVIPSLSRHAHMLQVRSHEHECCIASVCSVCCKVPVLRTTQTCRAWFYAFLAVFSSRHGVHEPLTFR
eukprot:5744659-Amphidinium_carterae.2